MLQWSCGGAALPIPDGLWETQEWDSKGSEGMWGRNSSCWLSERGRKTPKVQKHALVCFCCRLRVMALWRVNQFIVKVTSAALGDTFLMKIPGIAGSSWMNNCAWRPSVLLYQTDDAHSSPFNAINLIGVVWYQYPMPNYQYPFLTKKSTRYCLKNHMVKRDFHTSAPLIYKECFSLSVILLVTDV